MAAVANWHSRSLHRQRLCDQQECLRKQQRSIHIRDNAKERRVNTCAISLDTSFAGCRYWSQAQPPSRHCLGKLICHGDKQKTQPLASIAESTYRFKIGRRCAVAVAPEDQASGIDARSHQCGGVHVLLQRQAPACRDSVTIGEVRRMRSLHVLPRCPTSRLLRKIRRPQDRQALSASLFELVAVR